MLMESYNDESVVRLINTILAGAMEKGASELHIEQFEHKVSFQYSADGIMNKLLEPPRQVAAQVIPRIKFMAKGSRHDKITFSDAHSSRSAALLVA